MDLDNMNVDDFLKKNEEAKQENGQPEKTLEQRFAEERSLWTNKIQTMSSKMQNVFKVSELLTDIYTERQIAVEYYHLLLTALSKVTKIYRKQWSEKYDHYSYHSQKRFPNERTKELQILSDIGDIVEKRELIDGHLKFINNTINTIDNLIYGIKYKVEIEQISRGR